MGQPARVENIAAADVLPPHPPPRGAPPLPARPPLQEREKADPSQMPKNGSPEDPRYYETLESTILFDSHTLDIPAYIARRRRRLNAAVAAAQAAAAEAAGGGGGHTAVARRAAGGGPA